MADTRCLSLQDPAATSRTVVGAKAAGLARARAAGLRVLPGVILPVTTARPVVEAVRPLLAQGQLGRVRRAAMMVDPAPHVVDEIRAAVVDWDGPLIVRSSSPLEGDGVWSGAFSSLLDVSPDEVATAVRACWGSAFSPDAMHRASHQGVEVDDLALAVLVQPQVHPDVGGTARVDGTGRVMISATQGPLKALMEGWVEGEIVTVAAGGEVSDTAVSPDVVADVAKLVRTTAEHVGHDFVEWAAVDGELWLLQSLRSRTTMTATEATTHVTPAHATDQALDLALLTQSCPGVLGEELVLPWAAACPGALADDGEAATDALAGPDRVARVRAAANELVARLWGGTPRAAREEALRTLRQLRGTDPGPALDRLASLPRPSDTHVDAVRADLLRLRDELVASGLVSDPDAFWRLRLDELDAAVEGRPVRTADRIGVGRWEPFLHAVVRATGEARDGTPAAPGAGAGPVHVVDDVWGQPPPTGRYVLVATSPIPALSQLLWNAAGLVTRGGSGHAHLLEFAASIGVPSVVGVATPHLEPGTSWFAAVDGDCGIAAFARANRVPTAV